MTDEISDIVRDYKLETELLKRYTVHKFNDPDAPPSSAQRSEYWEYSQSLGYGGQGKVILQKCVKGIRHHTERAVKIIPLRDGNHGHRYVQELETIIKFSHDRVCISLIYEHDLSYR